MKKIYLLFFLFAIQFLHAQTIGFPDQSVAFKNALVTSNEIAGITYNSAGQHMKVDTNGDGHIQYTEAQQVWEIKIEFNNAIQQIQGIEYFTNLRKFYCHNTGLIVVNLQQLVTLKTVTISGDYITSVVVTNLPNLEDLTISQTEITTLNLSGLTAIKHLDVSHNSLSSTLDVSQKPNLLTFDASYNLLLSVNVAGSVNLENISLLSNRLQAIDLTGMANLKYLNVLNNKISSLNVNGFTKLVTLSCGNNLLTSLNIQTLTKLEYLYCQGNTITTLNPQGLAFIKEIACTNNQLTTLNVQGLPTLININISNNSIPTFDAHGLPLLKFLYCSGNQMTDLNVTALPLLEYLSCDNNRLTTLNITQNPALAIFECNNNLLTTLNIEQCPYMSLVRCQNNQLESLYIKNGGSEDINFSNNPSLTYMCIDEFQADGIYSLQIQYNMTNVDVNSFCNDENSSNGKLTGALRFYQSASNITGPGNAVNNVKMYNTANARATNTNATGNYTFTFYNQTSGSVYPVFENPSLFYAPVTSFNFTYFNDEVVTRNISFWPSNETGKADIETVLLPIVGARPGEDATYKLLLRNKGNTNASGNVILNFNDDTLNLVSAVPVAATQQTGILTWNYTDMLPFETREILIVMHVNSPTDTPAVVQGYILNFTASATLTSGIDYTPSDNSFAYNQTVVNSFDPNDKTCLQGDYLPTAEVGKYVHYIIRFENTGNANANKVIVSDAIDPARYDINTLVPLSASHAFEAKRNNDKLDFVFTNINLPFDDANNDGYIAFKVKTHSSLVQGNILSNLARIYFDYNLPIVTNKAVTSIGQPQPPVAPAVQTFCNTATISGLTVTNTGLAIKWYSAQTGGTLLPPATVLVNGSTYYAANTTSAYESIRTAVTVFITATQSPVAPATQLFCTQPTVNNLVITSGTTANKWYTVQTGGTALASTAPLSNATTYYVSQTVNNCESLRTPVMVSIVPTPTPEAVATQTLCNDAIIGNISVTIGIQNNKWYAAQTGGAVLPLSTVLSNGSTYYVSQTINNCESARTAITVSLASTLAPVADATQTFCTSATLNNLVITNGTQNNKWYAVQTGGTALNTSTSLINGTTYYVSQTANNCESARTPVTVTLTAPQTPVVAATLSFCNYATVANLGVISGNANNKWYTAATGGNALNGNIGLANGATYYVSQTINGCESARSAVTVTISTTPAPTAAATQSLCPLATVNNVAVTSGTTNNKWYTAQAGGLIVAPTTTLVNGVTYYVSQTVNDCESPRTPVTVTINNIVPPTGNAVQTVQPGDMLAAISLTFTGTVKWYLTYEDAIAGQNALPANYTFETGTGIYYATQTLNGCESMPFAVTVTAVLGTDSFTKNNLIAYPNPVTSTLTISYGGTIQSVDIYTLTGQKISSQTINNSETTIEMYSFASGVYMVKVSDGKGSAFIRVVKQ